MNNVQSMKMKALSNLDSVEKIIVAEQLLRK